MSEKREDFLDILRDANSKRRQEFRPERATSLPEWGNALAGEVGELCNLIHHKFVQGRDVNRYALGSEVADVLIYLDLLAADLGLNISEEVTRKFNETSRKNGLATEIEPRTHGKQGGVSREIDHACLTTCAHCGEEWCLSAGIHVCTREAGENGGKDV
jgi:NTP pyrophosphatase (non-canonical NTP hydrolase)